MKSWRATKRRRGSPYQPSLPGLTLSSPRDGIARKAAPRMTSPGDYALDRARLRLPFLFFGFIALFIILMGRLGDLTLLSEAPESPTSRVTQQGVSITSRADILDRRGTVLATSLPTVTLIADAKRILDINDAAAKLVQILPDMDAQKLADDLRNAKHYVTIRRHLTPRQYYEINRLGIAGLEYSPDEARIYPAGSVSAHVLGYTDIDNNGIAGIEKTLNARLVEKPDPVTLSVDLRVQTIMHRELKNAIAEYNAIGASGIVMDARTGEVIAMVSLPDFDPRTPGSAPDDARFNRATLGVYEMGSTFKTFTMAMGLDSGLVRPQDRFDTIHPIEIGRRTIRDYHPSKYPLNVAEIYMESSNIGSARIAEKMGGGRQKAFLKALGLLDKAPIELPEVGTPIVPSPASWGETATMTISYGHGLAVNAVQLVSAVASLIHQGTLVKPTLFKGSPSAEPIEEQRVISPKTVALMRALMRLVVVHGTAKKAEAHGYIVGGKTGTADKLNGRHYSENARMASFVGVFPINAPRYVVHVMLDDPKGNAKTYGFATGGWTAAPVVGKVIGQIGPLLDLPPSAPEVLASIDRSVLKPLGADVLDRLHVNMEEDYAAQESTGPR